MTAYEGYFNRQRNCYLFCYLVYGHNSLNDSPSFFQVWFQNRRARLRRTSLKAMSAQQPADLSTVFATNRKRKSPCEVVELENSGPPSKKLVTVSPSMSVDFLSRSSRSPESSSSASPRSSECGAIHLQERTSRGTHRCATSPLMSVDFLARSTCSSHTPPAARTEFAFSLPVGQGHPFMYFILP